MLLTSAMVDCYVFSSRLQMILTAYMDTCVLHQVKELTSLTRLLDIDMFMSIFQCSKAVGK